MTFLVSWSIRPKPLLDRTPGNPMSDTMVQGKFYGLASIVLGVEKANKAKSALWSVETMPDVSQLIPLLLK